MSMFYAISSTILSDFIHNRFINGIFGGLFILIGWILAILLIKID